MKTRSHQSKPTGLHHVRERKIGEMVDLVFNWR